MIENGMAVDSAWPRYSAEYEPVEQRFVVMCKPEGDEPFEVDLFSTYGEAVECAAECEALDIENGDSAIYYIPEAA